MNRIRRKLPGLFAAGMFVLSSAALVGAAQAGVPYQTAQTPKAVDRGALAELAGATPISVTVALRLTDPDGAEALMKDLYTRGNPLFHQFLTPGEFAARFAPSGEAVQKVIDALAAYRLTATRTTALTLEVTGLPADFERAFAVTLHSYEVAGHGSVAGYSYRAPLARPTLPAAIAAQVAAIAGLDTRPQFHPHTRQRALQGVKVHARPEQTGNEPGAYTVADFVAHYDVQPLYNQGITGRGYNIGIMTFASMTTSDAFAYWSALGLKVNPDRLNVVNIDGGPGAPSDDSGSLETTIDTEQSGGIATGANITIYQAPNTDQGWVDLFAVAIEANWAQSLSISWGGWEWFFNLENSPVSDPFTGQTVSMLQATHELLVRAAIQGQSVYTASGDGGAYEAYDDGYGPPDFSLPLSAEYPASDTAMTAGGGTTLASVQEFLLADGSTLTITIPHTRVWGWDWLQPLCDALGAPNPLTCGIFSVGSGGGVSVYYPVPYYQAGLPGVQLSQPHQQFIEYLPPPAVDYFNLPAFYAGRNVPDISFDADPYTGYEVYYTSSVTGYGIEYGWGGTSFVAPQLNGVTALFNQYLHGRTGFLNPVLYELGSGPGYLGFGASIRAVPFGDNWFYYGSNGYNPAVGFGQMDVANFANALGVLSGHGGGR